MNISQKDISFLFGTVMVGLLFAYSFHYHPWMFDHVPKSVKKSLKTKTSKDQSTKVHSSNSASHDNTTRPQNPAARHTSNILVKLPPLLTDAYDYRNTHLVSSDLDRPSPSWALLE